MALAAEGKTLKKEYDTDGSRDSKGSPTKIMLACEKLVSDEKSNSQCQVAKQESLKQKLERLGHKINESDVYAVQQEIMGYLNQVYCNDTEEKKVLKERKKPLTSLPTSPEHCSLTSRKCSSLPSSPKFEIENQNHDTQRVGIPTYDSPLFDQLVENSNEKVSQSSQISDVTCLTPEKGILMSSSLKARLYFLPKYSHQAWYALYGKSLRIKVEWATVTDRTQKLTDNKISENFSRAGVENISMKVNEILPTVKEEQTVLPSALKGVAQSVHDIQEKAADLIAAKVAGTEAPTPSVNNKATPSPPANKPTPSVVEDILTVHAFKDEATPTQTAGKVEAPPTLSAGKDQDSLSPPAVKDETAPIPPAVRDESTPIPPAVRDKAASTLPVVKDKAASTLPAGKDKTASTAPAVKDEIAVTSPAVEDETAATPPAVEDETAATPPAVEDETAATPPAVEDETAATPPAVEDETAATPPAVEDETAATPPAVEDETAATPPAVEDEAAATPPAVEDEAAATPPAVEDEAAATPPAVEDEAAATPPAVEDEAAATPPAVEDEAAATPPAVEDEAAATPPAVEDEAAATPPAVEDEAAATPPAVEDEAAATTPAVEDEAAATPPAVEDEAAATPPAVEDEAAATPPAVEDEAAATPPAVEDEAAATPPAVKDEVVQTVTRDKACLAQSAVKEKSTVIPLSIEDKVLPITPAIKDKGTSDSPAIKNEVSETPFTIKKPAIKARLSAIAVTTNLSSTEGALCTLISENLPASVTVQSPTIILEEESACVQEATESIMVRNAQTELSNTFPLYEKPKPVTVLFINEQQLNEEKFISDCRTLSEERKDRTENKEKEECDDEILGDPSKSLGSKKDAQTSLTESVRDFLNRGVLVLGILVNGGGQVSSSVEGMQFRLSTITETTSGFYIDLKDGLKIKDRLPVLY